MWGEEEGGEAARQEKGKRGRGENHGTGETWEKNDKRGFELVGGLCDLAWGR